MTSRDQLDEIDLHQRLWTILRGRSVFMFIFKLCRTNSTEF